MDDLMEKFKHKLSSHNYKLTDQRQDILKVFLNNPAKHYNAEELFQEVKEINPELGLATVYRTLELFCELDILHQLDLDSNYKSYELNIEEKHHHHLVCLECGKITEFNDRVLEEFEENLEKNHQFDIVDHRIKFFGYCSECSDKNN